MADAVMFDIDDTLFKRDGKPIKKSIDLLVKLKKMGYIVVIMTARPATNESIDYTVKQIKGLPYDRLFFVPARYKTREKKRMGLNFVLSVGDKYTDLGASKYSIKLPSTSNGYYNLCK
jgi:ribonucleotide monophosphatase NagD (HAD superfamily)